MEDVARADRLRFAAPSPGAVHETASRSKENHVPEVPRRDRRRHCRRSGVRRRSRRRPRSGRAVSRAGAGDWAPRLLPLPDCLANPAAGDAAGLPDAFRTTGHFLAAHLAAALGDRPLPEARARLVAALARAAAPGA